MNDEVFEALAVLMFEEREKGMKLLEETGGSTSISYAENIGCRVGYIKMAARFNREDELHERVYALATQRVRGIL